MQQSSKLALSVVMLSCSGSNCHSTSSTTALPPRPPTQIMTITLQNYFLLLLLVFVQPKIPFFLNYKCCECSDDFHCSNNQIVIKQASNKPHHYDLPQHTTFATDNDKNLEFLPLPLIVIFLTAHNISFKCNIREKSSSSSQTLGSHKIKASQLLPLYYRYRSTSNSCHL